MQEKTLGMKFDSEKPRMGLLPPRALESVAEVLTFGAQKYLPNNWKYVENGPERYLDAALRHITAYMRGEYYDNETYLPHLSHALCCLMFIVDLELEKEEIDSEAMFDYGCDECGSGYSTGDFEVRTTDDTASLVNVMDSMVRSSLNKSNSQTETLRDVIDSIIRNNKRNQQ